jgi:ketosteroid isomerase-like protein
MTDIEIQDFVTRFAAAWAERDGEAFLALWHPDGVLRSPLYDRPVAGKELGRLTEIVRQRASMPIPHLCALRQPANR